MRLLFVRECLDGFDSNAHNEFKAGCLGLPKIVFGG
jgi:hypothetical protein